VCVKEKEISEITTKDDIYESKRKERNTKDRFNAGESREESVCVCKCMCV